MPSLSAYSNVENTALVILQEKGFQIWYDSNHSLYYGEKDGWDFAADSAVELLGLVSIFEFTKPDKCVEYWWRRDQPNLRDNLVGEPKPYKPVWQKDEP